ncbi:hypothetical protein [Pseudaestuariivita rosea]|uniref:hypothetical protein n=1 Tax=Pseudaestuariivita rosea TaxID=2763263 RepID=UPI001ABB6FAA|nr:hypothetical protein [Pseudaestuariivita rosea]
MAVLGVMSVMRRFTAVGLVDQRRGSTVNAEWLKLSVVSKHHANVRQESLTRMPAFDPSKMTREERKEIQGRAQRNVGSEVTLILTAGFGLVMIILFFFGTVTVLPLAERLEMQPMPVWIGLSVLICFTCGMVHAWRASRNVARARERQFMIHQFDEARKRSETQEKIRALKEKAL